MVVKAVSFDLWFTLIWEDDSGSKRYYESRVDALYEGFRRHIDVDRDTIKIVYDSTRHLWMVTPIQDLVKYISQILGLRISDEDAESISRLYIESTRRWRPNIDESVYQIIEYLYGKGYKLGILSNTSFNRECIIGILDGVGLSRYFDVIVSSCDIGVIKPFPGAFERLLEELGVAPSEAIHIGDTILDDVIGAWNIGINGLLYTGLWDKYDSYTPFRNKLRHIPKWLRDKIIVINDLDELRGIL